MGSFHGGATFDIRQKPSNAFVVNAVGDKEIDKNDPITLTPVEILEATL